jgi:hypothetical protein
LPISGPSDFWSSGCGLDSSDPIGNWFGDEDGLLS